MIYSDPPAKTPGAEDSVLINVSEPAQIGYWSQQLGVAPAVLLQAIRGVGPLVANIKEKIGMP